MFLSTQLDRKVSIVEFIKQYGMYRTGTNYLRALLCANYNTRVLTNTLGHKHSLPEDWSKWAGRQHVRGKFLDSLTQAVADNEVGAMISIKNPYGSVYSYVKWRDGWHQPIQSLRLHVHDYCVAWNHTYKAWFQLTVPKIVVKYEDLLQSHTRTLTQIATQFILPARTHYRDIPNRVEAGDRHTNVEHDRKFWIKQSYMKLLPTWARNSISTLIDWDLLEELQYSKV